MSWNINWNVVIDPSVKKVLNRIPEKDAGRITFVLREFIVNPYSGDIEKMEGRDDSWRRRVGSYRIFYEVHKSRRIVYVFKLKRKTSTTY